MTILVQRKYSIYTKFLDVVLQSEDVIREGETRQEALSRVRRELDATADEWRKEAAINGTLREEDEPPPQRPAAIPVIDRSAKERIEIAIDNAATAVDLAKLKDDAGKYGLISEYMKRLKYLSA